MSDKKIEELLKQKKIKQIINSRVMQGSPDISLKEGVKLMQKNRAGYLLLVENDQPVGIFTETDVVRKILGQDVNWDEPVRHWMTPNPLVLKPNDSIGEAIDLMADKRIYHLPLADENKKLMGMLSARTLIRFLSEYYPDEVYNLPPDPNQVSSTQEGG